MAHSTTNASTSSADANTSAWRGSTAPVTSGRFRVRSISWSMSRSTYMLNALAPPAASVPPTSVQRTSAVDGQPRSASTIVGTVVISSSSMMRGLVSARYAPAFEVAVRRLP